MEGAFATVKRGGKFLVFGVAPQEASMSLSPFRIYNDEITVLGSMAVLFSFGPALDLLHLATDERDQHGDDHHLLVDINSCTSFGDDLHGTTLLSDLLVRHQADERWV